MGFRENLKDELEYQGLKVRDLAEKSGISRRTIDQYLASCAKIPSAVNAVKIARVLNVSVEYLVSGEEENAKTENQLQKDAEEITRNLKSLNAEQRKALIELVKSAANFAEKNGF